MERWTVQLKMMIEFSPHPTIFKINSMLQFCTSFILQCSVTRRRGRMERWIVQLKMMIEFSPHLPIFKIKSMLQFCTSLPLQCPVIRVKSQDSYVYTYVVDFDR
ncbi:hypothetical protein HanPSC8_Chr08g0330371 [Helianthus annuus]|nr:hypothetical protein HanPSC8_Chr08g0330371 [Helianthus annuus]